MAKWVAANKKETDNATASAKVKTAMLKACGWQELQTRNFRNAGGSFIIFVKNHTSLYVLP